MTAKEAHFGDRSLTWENLWEHEEAPGTAAAGLAFVERCYAAWRNGVVSQSEDFLDAPSQGPPRTIDGQFPFADVILHVNAEVTSHGAEISLLRDLYLARPSRN